MVNNMENMISSNHGITTPEEYYRLELDRVSDGRKLRALELAVELERYQHSYKVMENAKAFYDFLMGSEDGK